MRPASRRFPAARKLRLSSLRAEQSLLVLTKQVDLAEQQSNFSKPFPHSRFSARKLYGWLFVPVSIVAACY